MNTTINMMVAEENLVFISKGTTRQICVKHSCVSWIGRKELHKVQMIDVVKYYLSHGLENYKVRQYSIVIL
jgi:hypothetical protein